MCYCIGKDRKNQAINHLVDLLEVVLDVEPRHGGRHLKRDAVRRQLVMRLLRVEQLHPEVGQVDAQLRVAPAVQRVTENGLTSQLTINLERK